MLLLKVCAWHPQYFGRRRFMGLRLCAPSLGRLVIWSHGMCRRCYQHYITEREELTSNGKRESQRQG